MANYNQIGAPKGLTIGTPSLSLTDLVDMRFLDDTGENKKHYGGTNRFARHTIGNAGQRLVIRTTDWAAMAALTKNLEVETISATWQAPVSTPAVGSGVVTLQHAQTLTVAISCARVVEIGEVTGTLDDVQVFEFTLEPSIKESTGAVPTITRTLA